MKILLVVGSYRLQEPDRIDHGDLLLRAIKRSSHQIEALLAPADDPLLIIAREHYGVQAIPLMPELTQSRRKIQAALVDQHVRQRMLAWRDTFAQNQPELGISFYGHWLPHALLELPLHGFLNFHPAPLPELRGMEPDTFAILEGRTHIHGTVHFMSEQYDEGPIVKKTRLLQLNDCTTPLEIFRSLSHLGISAVRQAIDDIENGQVAYVVQDPQQATYATRQRARQESFLNLKNDDTNMIHRRYRAFLGQNIGICLKAHLEQCLYQVLDLEIWKGLFPGKPGNTLGHYCGSGPFADGPIVRVTDGLVVLRIGKILRSSDLKKEVKNTSYDTSQMTFKCQRKRLTSLCSIKKSIGQKL